MGQATSCLIALTLTAVVVAVHRRWYLAASMAAIRGPTRKASLLYGNLLEHFQEEAGACDQQWIKDYGTVVRFKGPFGQDRILVADPKALQYIYHTSGYNFPMAVDNREMGRWVMGRGLLWAEGDIHKRQRKIMNPAFGTVEVRGFMPVFRLGVQKMSAKWSDDIMAQATDFAVMDVHGWLARATLDSIGTAAFDYEFGALDNSDNELANLYHNLLANVSAVHDKPNIFVQGMLSFLPIFLLQFLQYFPSGGLRHARKVGKMSVNVARDLIANKTAALERGEKVLGKDAMSLLVKANATENPAARLTEEEMLAQLSTFMLAGHETTANTLSWGLLELAKHPRIQVKLREEIRGAQHAAGGDLTSADMEQMQYLNAFVKELLRFYPAAYNGLRQAGKDDVLPLAMPVTLETGEVVTEVPIRKGVKVVTSIFAYNRLKEVWGADADEFVPERWIDRDKERQWPALGVIANLASFGGGIRSCVGWRFALMQLQTFLVEVVGTFSFALPEGQKRIRRTACGVLVPMIEGEYDAKLPLAVSIASHED